MAEHIFLSFSLKPLKEKGRTFENAILPAMEKLAERYSKATLHHGFLSREEVLARNLPTNVIDAIERLFPNTVQYSPIDGEYQKMRGTMASQAKELDNALVIVIGPVVEGVEEEVNAYVKAGMGVHYHLWEHPKTKFTVHIDGKVWTEQSVAEELAEIVIWIRAAALVVFDEGNRTHLHHRQAFPLGRLDDVAAVVDAMRESSQSAALILPLRIVEVDHVLSRDPLRKHSVFIAKRVFFRRSARQVDDPILQFASAQRAVGDSFRRCDPVRWDPLINWKAVFCLGQQDEDLTVDVDRARPCEKIRFEIVHPSA